MDTSNVDVTFTTRDIAPRVKNWRVLDKTNNDHRLLVFEIDRVTTKRNVKDRHRLSGWKADCYTFRMALVTVRESITNPRPDLHEYAACLTETNENSNPCKGSWDVSTSLGHRGGIKTSRQSLLRARRKRNPGVQD